MKFPPSAKGALTLALGQTKDHTVQAAMRSRQLKTTQSILFVAPPEVHLSIVDVCKKRKWQTIDSADIVYWLLEQTCITNEQVQGLFFAQGQDYCRHINAAHVNKGFLKKASQRAAYTKVLEQPERQTLEEMYGPRPPAGAKAATSSGEETANMSSQKLKDISTLLTAKCKSVNTNGGLDVLGEVEQEREVEFQVEEVRDVRKPVKHEALKFPGLQKEFRQFVESGKLGLHHPFRHVITISGDTEIGMKYIARPRSTKLFASTEFERTIELKEDQRNDSFMRPVEWILWSTFSETGIVIIREEAEKLVDSLREQVNPKVYLVTYAATVTKAMDALGRMSFYTIPSLPTGYEYPRWLSLEVGIFAGRLYLDFESWTMIAKQLQDGSIKDDGKHEPGKLVARDPRGFLLDWLTFRRQLTKDHAFFVEAVAEPMPLDKSVDSEASASGTDDGKEMDYSSSEGELDDS
ncbi:hypothetical protein PGQ11_012276 [Apiospora arundinis]|uniref:ubiquitinyl hydrolase 1 n=1 Tax=Apiospora arundinis TaxID=335852 RepID=A0ABR2I1X9_9PEZI